jgi:hypothetical protein
MAHPNPGYIMKIPSENRSIFDGESLLKLTKKPELDPNNDDYVRVDAMTPAFKPVSVRLKKDKFIQIINNNPIQGAKQQFNKEEIKKIKQNWLVKKPKKYDGKRMILTLKTKAKQERDTQKEKEEKQKKKEEREKKKEEKEKEKEKEKEEREKIKKKKEEEKQRATLKQKLGIKSKKSSPPRTTNTINRETVMNQLVQKAIANLRVKLSGPNYPKEYVLDLSVLKNDPLFKQDTFNLLKHPKYKTFDSILSSLFAANLANNNKYKFQTPDGKGIVDLDVIKRMKFSLDDFSIIPTTENELLLEMLNIQNDSNMSKINFSNFSKDTKFLFEQNKEKEIINLMKEKKLSTIKSRISTKLLEYQQFNKKGQDPYTTLSDTIVATKMIVSSNKKELDAFRKYFNIKSVNNNQVRKDLLGRDPRLIIRAQKTGASKIKAKLRKQTQATRKKPIKPIIRKPVARLAQQSNPSPRRVRINSE